MDLNLSAEEREIRDWVRTFVTKELMPLEPTCWPASVAASAASPARS